MDFTELRHLAEQIETECGKAIIGKGEQIRLVLTSLFAGGHVLIDDIPGVGKTTLAKIVATQLERPFFTLSAVTSGVKDVREVIESAKKQRFFDAKPPFLFIDEIHRFNKSQQDSLLGAVEQGTVTLIGATTENPSFEVISPLLSRCQVYILRPMEDKDLQTLLDLSLIHI